MAEDQQELRSVNWNEVFAFTHIFKCWRMAIQPSKLLLSAAAIVLLFLAGRGLDLLWSTWGSYAAPGEIALHATSSSAAFDRLMDKRDDARLEQAAQFGADAWSNEHSLASYMACASDAARQGGESLANSYLMKAFADALNKYNEEKDKNFKPRAAADVLEAAKKDNRSWSSVLSDADERFIREEEKVDTLLQTAQKQAEDEVNKLESGKQRTDAKQALALHEAFAEQAKTLRRREFHGLQMQIRGQGLSAALEAYELNCLRGAVAAVWRGRIASGLGHYKDLLQRRVSSPPIAVDAADMQGPSLVVNSVDIFQAAPAGQEPGFLLYVLMAYRGVIWLLREHSLYALAFLLVALALCALFGGAVSRIAALHFAREEKISWSQGLRFAVSKFLSFFTAPLIPLAIILFLGGLLALGGVVVNIPLVGEIIAGVLFLLALLVGLGIAFLTVGLSAGGGLMYPTIAVEGSDSFDAISRSYSYVLARPWRSILYGLVALVYGVVTYVFVRLFAFIALRCTHDFVKWGVWASGDRIAPGADKLDVLWTAPTFDSLFGPVSWDAISGWQAAGAFLINAWVFLVAAVVAGYLLSYAASATTVIYYLLRRKVDATDLDDVYVEETPEPGEPAPGAETAAPAAEAPAPAAEPPAAPPAPDEPAPPDNPAT